MWIKPVVISIDESQYWQEDRIAEVGKVYGVYIYDENTVTYCCSLDPSYLLEPLGFFVTKVVDEKVEEFIENERNKYTEAEYAYCRVIDNIPDGYRFNLRSRRCKKEDYDDTWQDVVDYFRSNTIYPYVREEE